jgi:hypothetical protein
MPGAETQLCIPSNEYALVILKSNVLGALSFHKLIILPTHHFTNYHFTNFSSIVVEKNAYDRDTAVHTFK